MLFGGKKLETLNSSRHHVLETQVADSSFSGPRNKCFGDVFETE